MEKNTCMTNTCDVELRRLHDEASYADIGGVPERSNGTDCKSVAYGFDGSNPSPSTNCAGIV